MIPLEYAIEIVVIGAMGFLSGFMVGAIWMSRGRGRKT